MAARICVVSWQCSGIAWQPWRTQQILAASDRVDYLAVQQYDDLERYGLPAIPTIPDPLTAARGADVFHLHHAYVAQEVIALLRAHYPKLKILVTLHGEPDRTLKRPCSPPPDAYHVVEPGLRSIATNAPCTFIPNHPARDLPRHVETWPRARRLYVPFSHVARHKNHDVLNEVEQQIRWHGWKVERARDRVTNDELLIEVARSAAVWVQLQGYLDLLTMECWALGALTIVAPPSDPAAWRVALGFEPQQLDTRRIDAALLDWDGVAMIRENREGMARAWTITRARNAWEDLLQRVASGEQTHDTDR